MKANWKQKVLPTVKSVESEVKKEWKKHENEYFEACRNDITAQVLAIAAYTLEREFNFGAKRQQQFEKAVKSTLEIMLKGIFDGRTFNTDDVIKHLNDKFGVNYDEWRVSGNDS